MIQHRYHGMNLLDKFRFMFRRKPYYVVLHPTARCNCKCSFCFNWKGVKDADKTEELTLEEIKKISESLGYVKYLTISGGEPFLRNDIIEICKTFYHNGTRSIAIHTNCSFPERVKNDTAKILKLCPQLYLTICPSIDTLYEKHDLLRRHDGLFNKIEKSIKSLKSFQYDYDRLCIMPVGVFFKETEKEALSLSNFFIQKYGLLHVKVIPRGDVNPDILPSFDSYINYVKQQKATTKWLCNREKLSLAYENFRNTLDTAKLKFIAQVLKTGKQELKCSAGTKTLIILPNGDVVACEPFLNQKKFFMGNLRSFDYDVAKLLSSDTAKKVKDDIKNSGCACTWECIIPINMLFTKKQMFFVLKAYIKNLIIAAFYLSKFVSEKVQRQLYIFSGRNYFLKSAKIIAKILRLSAKSAIRKINIKEKEKYDVLLVNPPYYNYRMTSEVKPHNEEPLGIMSIASFLKMKKFKVRIIDMVAEEMRIKDVIKEIKQAQPLIIGISAITRQANIAYNLGIKIKRYYPKAYLIYGGIHPTFFPKEPFEKGYADIVVVGEGEATMYELCNSLLRKGKSLSQVNSIVYREAGSLMVNKPGRLIKSINTIPISAYDLLRGKYQTNIHIPLLNKKRTFSIMASRGCPYNCHYCGIPTVWKRTVRHRSPKHVIAEIRNAITSYKVKNFHFYDDDFLIDEKFVRRFCNALIKEGLNVTWLCQSRTSSIVRHRNLIPLLNEAGCKVIELGIESCDESVMQRMNKMQRLNDVKESVKIIREQGMEVLPLIMAFYPGETLDSVYHNSELMISLKLWSNNNLEIYTRKNSPPQCNGAPFIHGFFTTAIPGSNLYDNAKKEGLVFTNGWDDYWFNKVNFLPRSFLEDIPVKTLDMNEDGFAERVSTYYNTLAYYLVKHDYIMGSANSIKNYIRFLYRVYSECDGKISAQEICEKQGNNSKEDFITACVALRFLAMFGLIRSKYAKTI